jgi:hypothetical protein
MSKVMDPFRGAGYIPTLTIKGYKKTQLKGGKQGELSVPYDASTFKVNNEIKVSRSCPISPDAGTSIPAEKTGSQLSVNLLFDDTTGAYLPVFMATAGMPYDNFISDSVENQIKEFMNLCYKQNADTKTCNYLTITTGSMPIMPLDPSGAFHCFLSEMKVKTNIVSVYSGQRLKVTVACTFQDASSPAT